MGRRTTQNPELAAALAATDMPLAEVARRTRYAKANSLQFALSKKGISPKIVGINAPPPSDNVVESFP